MEEQKTFFGKLLQGLLEIFKNNWEAWVRKLWNKQIPDEIKPEVALIVKIVENIKNYVESPGIDLITAVIPGEWDNEAVGLLRRLLRGIFVDEGLDYKPTSELTRGQLQTIASELTAQYLDMPYGQAAITVEGGFQNLVKLK